MSHEKRLVLCVVLVFGWILVAPALLRSLGLLPPAPAKKAPAPAAAANAAKKEAERPAADEKARDTLARHDSEKKPEAEEPSEPKGAVAPEKAEKSEQPEVDLIPASKLVLGSSTDKAPAGYRLEVRLEQKGAGVESILSSRFDAEFEGRKNPHAPLHIIRRDPLTPPSLSITLSGDDVSRPTGETPGGGEPGASELSEAAAGAEDWLDSVLWSVDDDGQGHFVRAITGEDPETNQPVEGQEVVFRTSLGGVIVVKTFRLWQNADGLEMELRFESPDRERTLSYNLMAPHGIPIEGEWYTGTFREVFFGTNNAGTIAVSSYPASEVAKPGKRIDSTALPLRFAGVQNQYFASFVVPYPAPASDTDRFDREAEAIVLHVDDKAPQKADVGVRIASKPVKVGPNLPHVQTFRVFAGPKNDEALRPYGAAALASYRKSWIPGASHVAHYFIAPTLSFTYTLTEWVGRAFGGTRGNWGVAIILLTLFVKLLMFPLGRKQALMAQRTQELQPHLKEIQEKYKDDKERQTRETLSLYKKHGVNPVSGCIPALIQLPIFVGLWQALNSSVALRHSPFLWINDLAAPDMLFRLPADIPYLGHWFNLLPIVVVGLMLFQTKLFSPPATTPEAEMQQRTMKYMMIFMAVMFYKVPSGLGIYFITSSLWSIGERLLLPKITHAKAEPRGGAEEEPGLGGGPRGRGGPGSGGNGPAPQKKPPSAFAQFWERILDEARKDPTYRRMIEERDDKDKGGKTGADDRRERGKPRARPGRK
jgi:YidC/Oxa1 family membrane protein insertase